jgi:hypothetical protein
MVSVDLADRLAGRKDILLREQRQRVIRILAGASLTDDFKSLFLELRSSAKSRSRFREIGDFIAHRDIRDRGPIANLVKDIFLSARVFLMIASGLMPSPEEAREAARANIRLDKDEAIRTKFAMRRQAAEAAVDRAANMLARGLYPIDRDRSVFNYYSNRLKWHPAFLDNEVIDEWVAVLCDNKLLVSDEIGQMRQSCERLTLYILTLLHGSEIALENGSRVSLQAGFFNKERKLEVKAYFTFRDLGKPFYMPLCVFLTSLEPEGRCDDALLGSEQHGWDMPIRLAENGRISIIN